MEFMLIILALFLLMFFPLSGLGLFLLRKKMKENAQYMEDNGLTPKHASLSHGAVFGKDGNLIADSKPSDTWYRRLVK